MGNRRYEVQFRACLLALGPPPRHPASQSLTWLRDRDNYRQEVKDWWVAWHSNANPPPKNKSIHRFTRSYMNWVEHQAAIQEDIPQ